VAHTTTLYSVDRDPTMMQLCASVARLLGDGPILSLALEAMVAVRVTAASDGLGIAPHWSDQCRTVCLLLLVTPQFVSVTA